MEGVKSSVFSPAEAPDPGVLADENRGNFLKNVLKVAIICYSRTLKGGATGVDLSMDLII